MDNTSRDDYYAILQVSSDAQKEVIDAAYRKLAQMYHPDVNKSPDAEEKMKRINYAYEILSDPIKRAAYNAARHNSSYQGPYQGQKPQFKRGFLSIMATVAMILVIIVIAVRLGIRLAIIILVISAIIWVIYSLLPKSRKDI